MALGRYCPRGARLRALAALSAASLVFLASAQAQDPDAIAWREDYAAALEESRADGRPLWIQFTGPWCPNCLKMERDSFTQSIVRDRARAGVIPVKLRSDVNEELAVSLGLSGLPASVILDPSRRVLASHQGYLGPEELAGFLDLAVDSRAVEPPAGGPAEGDQLAEWDEPGQEANAPVALGGYCPVALVAANQMVPGRDDLAFAYEGHLYKCADQTALEKFRRDPERYAPASDGACPVSRIDRGEAVGGDPRWGVLYQGRLYLCASEAEQLQFVEDPGRYAAVDVEDGGYCPHCIAQSGKLVPGVPKWGIARDGRRYWFPDSEHRRAFLTTLLNTPIRR